MSGGVPQIFDLKLARSELLIANSWSSHLPCPKTATAPPGSGCGSIDSSRSDQLSGWHALERASASEGHGEVRWQRLFRQSGGWHALERATASEGRGEVRWQRLLRQSGGWHALEQATASEGRGEVRWQRLFRQSETTARPLPFADVSGHRKKVAQTSARCLGGKATRSYRDDAG